MAKKIVFDVIEVKFCPYKAKTKAGKDNIWVAIRQKGKKKYIVSENLSYVHGVDVLFKSKK